MASGSVKKRLPTMKTEEEVDRWLQRADLTDYFTGEEFQRIRFSRLERKLVDESYAQSLKSQPVTLRLPQGLVQKLKLAAIKKGIAYQTLARLLLQERVNRLLAR